MLFRKEPIGSKSIMLWLEFILNTFLVVADACGAIGPENLRLIFPRTKRHRLREGEIEAIVITNDPLIMGGPIFINIFTNTISSTNPSSYLVSDPCHKTSD